MASLGSQNWHALSRESVVGELKTSAIDGLSETESIARQHDLGMNALPAPKSASLAMMFLSQLKSPLIYLLLGAAAIALLLGHYSDSMIIGGVVLLNAIIGAVQEGRAKRSLESLRRYNQIQVHVVRDGIKRLIDAAMLVPGDIIALVTGDAIPADARIIEATACKTSESQLTGESTPVIKHCDVVDSAQQVSARSNMVYAGTYVVSGHARAVVVATGIDSELGVISRLSETQVFDETPLDKKIAQFGKNVLVVAGIVLVSMITAGLLRGIVFGEILIIAISQIVGLIPEGLPIAVTVAHAVAVQRMAKKKALTRKLAALETLGSVDVICTDKTGTLTENEMTVQSIRLPGRFGIDVTGSGYTPEGELLEQDRPFDAGADMQLRALLEACVVCNDARLDFVDGAYRAIGDPTEIALLTVAKKAGLAIDEIQSQYVRCGELPFDSDMKMMATAHVKSNRHLVVIKGAPESIIDLCSKTAMPDGERPLDNEQRQKLLTIVDGLAKRALRVIAVATIDNSTITPSTSFATFMGKGTFLGFLGQIDPPRAGVKDSIKICRAAGIRPVMVTGDHKETGRAIAQELELEGDAIDGEELDRLTDDELIKRIDHVGVFARVLPAQKLRIVNSFKARRNIVAMTGDGVNDAPALVRADVGVAMGRAGTEVAKEAAKIVITDDNFSTIVSAIEQGRVVYQNIQKAILLLVSTAAAETLILFLAIALGYPPPFTAVQILWINLVTETAIVLNLVMDPPEGNEMSMPPTPQHHGLVPFSLMLRIAGMTSAIFLSTLCWFIMRIKQGTPLITAQTESFTMLVVCDWLNVLNCRSRVRSALSLSLFRNPWLVGGLLVGIILQAIVIYWRPLGELFTTTPISIGTAALMFLAATPVIIIEEIRKVVVRRW